MKYGILIFPLIFLFAYQTHATNEDELLHLEEVYALADQILATLNEINNMMFERYHIEEQYKNYRISDYANYLRTRVYNDVVTRKLRAEAWLYNLSKNELIKHIPSFINHGSGGNAEVVVGKLVREIDQEQEIILNLPLLAKYYAKTSLLNLAINLRDKKVMEYLLLHNALTDKSTCWNLHSHETEQGPDHFARYVYPLDVLLERGDRELFQSFLGYVRIADSVSFAKVLNKRPEWFDLLFTSFILYRDENNNFAVEKAEVEFATDIRKSFIQIIYGLSKQDQQRLYKVFKESIDGIVADCRRMLSLLINNKNIIDRQQNDADGNLIAEDSANSSFEINSENHLFCFNRRIATRILATLFANVQLNALGSVKSKMLFSNYVKFLIAQGAYIDVYVQENPGVSIYKTPLHKAIGQGNSKVARLLLRQGAHPDMVDSKGVRPLQMAHQI